MLHKDFENFELRLVKLREESREDFESAEKVFQENYASKLEKIFPRDILGAKKLIAGSFILDHAETAQGGNTRGNKDIFSKSVSRVIGSLHLSADRKESLKKNILSVSDISTAMHEYFNVKDTISRDPFFALVEDFSIDGEISKEEFVLLQHEYEKQGDFLKALDCLPEEIKNMFHRHIELTLGNSHGEKRGEFESEYSNELRELEKRGVNVKPVVAFVSRSFYKTPGKYKKYEHPKRRMRRTFKIALLRLLQAKLGNIDAKIILEHFENGENFEDMFLILFKLLEVINEDPKGEEIYSILKLEEDLESDVFTAEENKQKILAGESLVMKIANLFSRADAKGEEQELEEGLLDKILDNDTDIVGEDVYFNRDDENAGAYSEGAKMQITHNDEEIVEEERDYDNMDPEIAYELLKKDFHNLEDEKRKAFLEGNYDSIDVYNAKLLDVQVRLEKLCAIFGYLDE